MEGTHSLYLYNSHSSPEYLVLPPASLLLSRLSGVAAAGPILYFLHFFIFPPKSPPVSTWRLQLFCGFLRYFASLPPSPILSSFPLSSSPFLSLIVSSLPSPFVCVCVCVCVCVFIYSIAHNRAIRPCHPSHSMCICVCIHSIARDRAIRPCHPSHYDTYYESL